MKAFYISMPALLAALASAAPVHEVEKRSTPTIYLAGDSTMASGGGGPGTDGWGVYFPVAVMNAKVVNAAIGGRSSRSYTDEGRFEALINKVVPGDYVVIEFGHNDGGNLSPTDNKRTTCLGSGSETCTSPDGVVVQTYVTYLTNAAKALVAKGAKVIISSPTPDNICAGTSCSYGPSRFAGYGKKVASSVGSSASFIDHGQYVGNEYVRLGKAKVDTFYPKDRVHTSAAGAKVVAQTFIKAVLCQKGVLAQFLQNSTDSVSGNCA